MTGGGGGGYGGALALSDSGAASNASAFQVTGGGAKNVVWIVLGVVAGAVVLVWLFKRS